jgi:ubiquinol-cytochrome c reductase cytochrome c subunit
MLSTGRMPIADVDARLVRSEPAYTTEQIEAIVDYTASIVSGPPVPEVHPGRGDAGFGAELYEQNCAACHSSTGVGAALTSGVEAPGIEEATPVQVAEAMLTGPGAMPVFGPETLSEHETNSLLRYVQTLQSTPDRGGSDLGGFGPVTEGAVAWLVGLGVCLLVVRWIGKRASE